MYGASMTEFVTDELMGYNRERVRYEPQCVLSFDATYRFAQLPLIKPDSHRVLTADADGRYCNGRRNQCIYSAVVRVDAAKLEASRLFQQMVTDLRASRVGNAVEWPLFERRRDRLHFTVVGGLSSDEPPCFSDDLLERVQRIGRFRVAITGLFLGAFNTGRMYLAAYPERRGGSHPLAEIGHLLGARPRDVFLCGIFNLNTELDALQTRSLQEIADAYWGRTLVTMEVRRVDIMWSYDDLVLDSGVWSSIDLS